MKGESAMKKKHFDQQQKLKIFQSAKKVGFKKASKIAGVQVIVIIEDVRFNST